MDSGGVHRELLPAVGVVCKELPQMQALDPLVVLLQNFPSGEPAQRWRSRRLLGPPCCARALVGAHRHLCHLAFSIALALPSMQAIRSFQDLEKDAAPSSCRAAASASTSTPTLAKLASTPSQSPPSAASIAPTLP